MRCVATWCFEPWLNKQGMPWTHVSDMLTAARASIDLMARHYGPPTIYTDTLGKKVFSAITDKAEFEVVYDDLYANMPTQVWALGKIMTYAAQQEPYIHFDLDFLCNRKLDPNLFECDILVQRKEDLTEWPDITKTFYNLEQVKQYNTLPPSMLRDNLEKIPAINVGFMFMNNMNLNKQYTDLALQLVRDNKHLFGTKQALQMCVIEQQTLGILLHDNPQYVCKTLKPIGWEQPVIDANFAHLIGATYKMDFDPHAVAIRNKILKPWRSNDISVMANFIQNERVRLWNLSQRGALSRGSEM